MKFLRYVLLAAVSVLPATSRAETDYIALPILHDIQAGTDNASQIEDLRVHDDVVIKDDVGIGGDLAVTGATTSASATVSDMNVGTNLDFAKTTITLTNGQAFALSGSWIELSNVGDPALVTTNAVTVAYPSSAVGRFMLVQAATANSNSIHLAESTTLILAATNLTLTAEDSVLFQIVATNKIRQLTALSVN